MSISKIKKIEIFGLKNLRSRLLLFLQKSGLVELIGQAAINIPPEESLSTVSDVDLLGIEETITYLENFEEKGGFLEGMVKLRVLAYKNQFEETIKSFDYRSILSKLSELRNDLKTLSHEKERMLQEKHLLTPWRNLSIALDKFHLVESCGILLGIADLADYEKILEAFEKEKINAFHEIIHKTDTEVYTLFIYLKENFEKLDTILKNHHFNFITLPRHTGTVKDRLYGLNSEILVLDDNIADLKTTIAGFSKERFKLMVIYDYLSNTKKRYEADRNLAKQIYTFSLSGWIKDKDIKILQGKLNTEFKEDIAIFIKDPSPGEDIPIALENKTPLMPFEVVTNLYGQPVYGGSDPTSYLAPFFAISFGFCMMDAGYGLVLLILMLFYMRKKEITPHGKNFLKFFLYMSVSTIIAGLVTGSFFADLIQRLPNQFDFLKSFQNRLKLFDPVKDSLLFLGITLALGYIQIWTGVFIKFIKDISRDKFTAFILDLPTLLVQSSLLIMVLIFAKALPSFMALYAGISLLLSCALIIYYQWKSNPDIGQKIFWSIFGIYSIVTGNFLADTLSFSRIFALGITGGLLAMAINEILLPKAPITNIATLIAALFALILWPIVQAIILGINVLGAYVQTSRLQYLEFFTKFFESGGRPFRPFKEETKYTIIKE